MISRSKIARYLHTFVVVKRWEVSPWLSKLHLRNLFKFSEGLTEHLIKGDL